MMAATHRLGGLAVGITLAAVSHADPANGITVIAGAVLGSLIPDIDNRHSAISRKWQLAGFGVWLGQGLIRMVSNIFPAKQRQYIRSLVGHRGLTHSLVPVVLMPLAAAGFGQVTGSAAFGYYAAAGLAGGILSHILFDMLSGGVPLLMPFSTRRIALAHIKTGGVAEWLFRLGLTMVFVYFGYEEVMSWLGLLHQ